VSAILLLFTLLFHQCDGTAVKSVDIKSRNGESIIASPIGHTRIKGNGATVDTARYLEGEEENAHHRREEENIHRRSEIPLSAVLLAALIVNVTTLVVLLSLIPILTSTKWSCFKSIFWVTNAHLFAFAAIPGQYLGIIEPASIHKKAGKRTKEETASHIANIFVPAYACGAILATTLFLIIPEAILFIQRGTSTFEGEIELLTGTISRFGAALMAGYMLPLVLGAIFPSSAGHVCTSECISQPSSNVAANLMATGDKRVDYGLVEDEEKEDEEKLIESMSSASSKSSKESFDDHSDTNDAKASAKNLTRIDMAAITEEETKTRGINFSLAISILFSDAIHNFFDGIFIGVAFLTCSNATAVCVTLITIYSEISQKMSDYFLLTKCAGVSIPRSILLIFTSGLATVVGAIVIINAKLEEMGIGIFLAFASGVYFHISATECLPRVYIVVKKSRDRWFAITFFIFGAVPIGLTLLSHEHCDA